MTVSPGAKFGPYEIVALLGAGGMGEVYRARDTRLGRSVAVKVLSARLSSDAEGRQRFEREARAVSSLNHPHICALYDVGEDSGNEYLVMEFLEGETLAERLVRGPLPPDEVLKIGLQVAEALEHAHRQGIIHRDLKPGNIMLTRSGAKLLDFGLAKLRLPDDAAPVLSSLSSMGTVMGSGEPLTTKGTVLGTFQYMAPEQLEGHEADARTDIFAFGSVIYEMCTGRRAFEGRTQASVIAAVIAAEPPPMPTTTMPTLGSLEKVVRICLSKDPEDRWQSTHDLALQLRWIAEGNAPTSRVMVVPPQEKTRERLAWGVAGFAIVGVLVLGGVFGFREWSARRAESTTVSSQPPAATPTASPTPTAPPAPDPTLAAPVVTPPVETAVAPTASPSAAVAPTPAPTAAVAIKPTPVPSASTRLAPTPRPSAPASAAASVTPTPTPTAAPSAPPKKPEPDNASIDLQVAQAKYDAKLYDQALADVQNFVRTHASSPLAADGYFLMAQIRERQNRPDEAMATYLELRNRYASAARTPEALYQLAQLVARSNRPGKEEEARKYLTEIVDKHPTPPWPLRALLARADIEERSRLTQRDDQLGATPAAVLTYRQVVAQFPSEASVEPVYSKLAEAYDSLRRYDLAAQTWADLAERFPNNRLDGWFRAGDIYEKRVKDKEKARQAFEKVPSTSPRFKEAQRRAGKPG